MSEKVANTSSEAASAVAKTQTIAIKPTDLAIFDDTLAFLRDKFSEEMRLMDENMLRLGNALVNFYNQDLTVQTGLTVSKSGMNIPGLEDIINSPLVQGEGEDKILKLQFDVSQFDPSEVTVRVSNDVLKVSATHNEKNESSSIHHEYNRQFTLPRGIDPETVLPSLSPDGVLTVEAPFRLTK